VFRSVLVANRAEIAVRVFRTARELGLRTIAVFSEADRGALHTRHADQAVCIGPAPPRESYLNAARVLAAAKETGAEAIHPGYGFLSENAEFAEAVIAAGLVWIGPPPAAIRAMGLKDEAKRIAEEAGVPVLPGYRGADQSLATLEREAERVGFPLLIKAVAGGGGRGIREVTTLADLAPQLESARREALAAFGNDAVMLERLVQRPRHIEVQVFGDTKGNVVHLHERDCSLQRRRQKVIEEAPAPGMNPATRAAMTSAAVKLAKAVGYVGAGTVEFIVDGGRPLAPDSFWFLEMNTRLQVEHPVTELVTGLDLVAWQLKVAAGEPLPRGQAQVPLIGHAIEARIVAEDPAEGFRPSVGRLTSFVAGGLAEARLDSGYAAGDRVPGVYDSLLAKMIVHGDGHDPRADATRELAARLCALRPAGLKTNIGFLVRALTSEAFLSGRVHTGLIADAGEALTRPSEALAARVAVAAGASRLLPAASAEALPEPVDPWDTLRGFRVNAALRLDVEVVVAGEASRVRALSVGRRAALIEHAGSRWHVALPVLEPENGRLVIALSPAGSEPLEDTSDAVWSGASAVVSIDPLLAVAWCEGEAFDIADTRGERRLEAVGGGDAVLAPMPGRLIQLNVKAGDAVTRGQTVAVLEAMKMELALPAPRDGVVAEVGAEAGAQVTEGTALVRLAALP